MRRSPVEPRVETKVPHAADDGDGEEEDDTLPRCGGCRRGMKNGPVTSTPAKNCIEIFLLYQNIFLAGDHAELRPEFPLLVFPLLRLRRGREPAEVSLV